MKAHTGTAPKLLPTAALAAMPARDRCSGERSDLGIWHRLSACRGAPEAITRKAAAAAKAGSTRPSFVLHRSRLRLLAALALAALAGTAAAASQSFSVELAGGRAKGNDTLKVRQGDQVQVRFSSDRPMVLHLHGYNINAKVVPPAPVVMTFKADLAGRFPVHEHREGPGHHRAALFIEVHP